MPAAQVVPIGLLWARQATGNGNSTVPAVLPPQSLDLSSYPTTGLQQFGLFLIVFFPTLSALLVGLRVYDRTRTKAFGLDDGFIIVATILAIAEAVFSFAMMKMQYIGVHIWQLPKTPSDPRTNLIVNYIVVMLYNPQLALVKSSVLFFMLRLGRHQLTLRRIIQVLNWSNIALLIAVLFASIFTCVPVYKYWDRATPGRCNNEALQYLITSGLTVLTDILVLAIPIHIVIGLQVARKLKIMLICVLCSGVIVTIFSILRMRALYVLYNPPNPPNPDPLYDIGFVYSTVECNLAIITASIPPLHGLMRKWFPRFFHLTGNSKGSGYPGLGRGNGPSHNGMMSAEGARAVVLKELKSPTRSQRSHGHVRLESPDSRSSVEEMMGKGKITRTTSVHVRIEDQGKGDGRDNRSFFMY
ncbi:hypothetical protein QBC34DRAFT_483140 [Podospora aff. communis PSN243]|uniref:Rhodopsin domain-containing protein n=1 Tax=Podospora aff. communis PSN243 TaxID=3040156 RepID=A0AAV9H0U8_9PEZI|nr:hypothetical protein QBC34DRAFT_483140 [Podospora aff. communis PSN243]